MGRRDEYDDDEDDRGRRPAKRGGVPPGVWVLLGVGGVGAVMLFGALALTAGRAVETRPTQTEPANKLYTRDEVRKLLVGKTADEVLQAVGKPDSTSETALGAYWYYRHKTTDPVTGQTDANAQVCFSNGQVVRINY